MHKSHLIGCGAGLAIAFLVVGLSGGSAGSLGVLAAVLICPVVMIGAMWFLMESDHRSNERGAGSADQHDPSSHADPAVR